MDPTKMTPTRPYLVRSMYDWILDNNCTPYVVVDAEYEGVEIPTQYVEDGKIILNISPVAVQGLRLANDRLEFNARFSGVPMHVYVPIMAVMAVYAKENGRGMVFSEEEEGGEPPPADEQGDSGATGGSEGSKSGEGSSGKGKPKLTVVK